MDVRIETSWKELLKEEFDKPYFAELVQFVSNEYNTNRIYPKSRDIFRAFEMAPVDKVKVVIIGQDPYHGPGQANGLCFSVNDGMPFPPSLRNIFTEINNDLKIAVPKSGNLDRWAEQGVLLLNSVLTVRDGAAASHQNRGWERFTDSVIERFSQTKGSVVYVLWGAYAQKKCAVIDRSMNEVLTSVHPSPLSAHRGFFGCNHFSKANEYLIRNGKQPINW